MRVQRERVYTLLWDYRVIEGLSSALPCRNPSHTLIHTPHTGGFRMACEWRGRREGQPNVCVQDKQTCDIDFRLKPDSAARLQLCAFKLHFLNAVEVLADKRRAIQFCDSGLEVIRC